MTPEVIEALCRVRLFPFLMRAFFHIHPDLPPLERAWYLQALCPWLEKGDAGELPRAMIWIQPRTLKSFTVAVVFPLWLLGCNPRKQIMIATYARH